MKKCITALLAFTVIYAGAQPQNETGLHQQLSILNKRIAKAAIEKNLDETLNCFLEDAVYMPEYHPAIYGKPGIITYFKSWLDSTTIISLDKAIVDIQSFGEFVIETGTFLQQYKCRSDSITLYNGKYLTVWKRSADKLMIVSEIRGAAEPVSRDQFSFIRGQAYSNPEPVADNELNREVAARNKRITELVKNRQGEKHAVEFFLPDAIYLTYDSPMFVGLDRIKAYFSEHEKPGDVLIDSLIISAAKIIDAGAILIEYGYYYIEVAWDGGKGNFRGKSTNIWKRDNEGRLMLYRQMVNHD